MVALLRSMALLYMVPSVIAIRHGERPAGGPFRPAGPSSRVQARGPQSGAVPSRKSPL